MNPLRIWHLMVVVIAAGILFTVAKFDSPCTPFAPLLLGSYVCGLLGLWGARCRGRRPRTGLWLGLLLGPIGVLFAWSNPVPEKHLRPDPRSHRWKETTEI